MTFTGTANFTFLPSSIFPILGFKLNTTYSSTLFILTGVFPMSVLGTRKLKICSDKLSLNNMDSYSKSQSIIQYDEMTVNTYPTICHQYLVQTTSINMLIYLNMQLLNTNFRKRGFTTDLDIRECSITDSVTLPDTEDFNNDTANFDWKYEINNIILIDEEFRFTMYQQHQSDVIIHEFLEKNVVGTITYNSDQLLIRTTFGYASTQGVCSFGYQLNILGWNKLKIIEEVS